MESNKQLHETDMEEENPDDVLKALCDTKLNTKLYPHQRDGIVFLFNAYKNGKSKAKGSRNGAILADEMGLGKSIQVIVFLHGMIMNTQEFKNALLVLPSGLMTDWKDKLEKWTPKINVVSYHHTEKELPKKLKHLQKTGGIILVSYKTLIYHNKKLTTYKGMPFVWDCLIFDEAHKLKNLASKSHKAAAQISAGFHILMTGTPIQNNLKEFWSLFSLISDTCLLGKYKAFKASFENPITKGMEADSGPEERALGMELQETLKKITEPFLLRRRKDQIQDPDDHKLPENIPSEQVLRLPKKKEYVVWIKLSPEQEAAYRSMIDESSSLTLQSIHSLIAVCTHPRLNSGIMGHEVSGVHLAKSGKLAFMLALLERLTANGNFVLVFSNYIQILNIIQDALTQTTWGRNAFLRIDGQNINQRDIIVKRFQKKRSENILLLTTSVGAEGLTLTAADSVVFADISWNQSQDAQAVGRAHRIGQTKEVATYRLITCGTLEETIYRRQLFKGSLTRQAMGDEQNPLRYFTQDQLKAMLTLQETQFSSTQQQLKKQGAKILHITDVFGESISTLGAASVCGVSDHGQLLTASQGEDLEVDMARMHITETVKMCKQQIEAESHLTRQQTCENVSVRKRFKKARGRTQETTTPGLPRKYKCFKTLFSGTRRKISHISRPCVFESSDDSSNLSADDDVNSSEKASPHMSVTVKSEATSDLYDKSNAATVMSNSTCSKDNSRITKFMSPRDTLEVSEYILKGHRSTDLDTDLSFVVDLDKDVSHVTDLDENGSSNIALEKDVSPVAVPVNSSDYHEHISTPDSSVSVLDSMDSTSDSEYCNESKNHKTSVSTARVEHSLYTSPEDTYINKRGTSRLLEANNVSVNTATVSSICRSMSDISLVQPRELTDLKEEAEPKGVKFINQRELQIQMNSEHDESVPLIPLNLNTPFSEYLPHSTSSVCEPSPELQMKATVSDNNFSQEILRADISCEDLKTGSKFNQVVPKLCDYSLTPSCISVCVTPSAGKGKHNTEVEQLGECDKLNALNDEENPQEDLFSESKGQKDHTKYERTAVDLSRHSFEYCEHLNHAHLASESGQSSSEREMNIVNHELADISYEDHFKQGLKSSQAAAILCDYSLNPECVSLIGTPAVEKRKHVLSGNFQSTPLQSGQVKHQESQDHLQRRSPFSQGNNITPVKSSLEGTLGESSQLKRSKKRTPGLPRKYKCFSPSLVKTSRRKTNLIFQESYSVNNFCQVRKHLMFQTQSHESTFSLATPDWKYGKENHDGLITGICGYSLNPSACSQFSPQTDKKTEIQSVQSHTDVKSTQLCPMNRDVDTDQPDIMSRVKATVSELLSSNNASTIKALRKLLIPKRQHRKTKQDSALRSKRPNFSLTYRRHKKKLLKSVKNVDTNLIIEYPEERDFVRSDAHISLIPNSHSLSPFGSHPELTEETSPTQNIQRSVQSQFIKSPNDIFTDDLSTSSTQFNHVIQTSNLDNYSRLQECRTADYSSASHEDDEDHGLHSTFQDELISMSHTSSVCKTDSDTSNGQTQILKSFTSRHELMWEMSFSPETQITPRKESLINDHTYCTHAKTPKTPNAVDQATSLAQKMRIQTCSDSESGLELELAFKSFVDSCSITESNNDSYDSVEQALSPVSNAQSPSTHNQTSRASALNEIQPGAQDIGDYTELSICHIDAPDDRNESMLRSEKEADLQKDVEDDIDEMFRLLHSLKKL